MNSDHKQVTCVCETVRHVRLETSQLLADRFFLCLQTERMGQSNGVGRLDRGFVFRRSKYEGRKEGPTTVRSHCRIPPEEGGRYISETLRFFYHHNVKNIDDEM